MSTNSTTYQQELNTTVQRQRAAIQQHRPVVRDTVGAIKATLDKKVELDVRVAGALETLERFKEEVHEYVDQLEEYVPRIDQHQYANGQPANQQQLQQHYEDALQRIKTRVGDFSRFIKETFDASANAFGTELEEIQQDVNNVDQDLQNVNFPDLIKSYNDLNRAAKDFEKLIQHPLRAVERRSLPLLPERERFQPVIFRRNDDDEDALTDDDNVNGDGAEQDAEENHQQQQFMLQNNNNNNINNNNREAMDAALKEDFGIKNAISRLAAQFITIFTTILKVSTNYFFDLIKFASEAFNKNSTTMNKGFQFALKEALQGVVSNFDRQPELKKAAAVLRDIIENLEKLTDEAVISRLEMNAPNHVFLQPDGPIMEMLETIATYWFAYYVAAKQLGNATTVFNTYLTKEDWKNIVSHVAAPLVPKRHIDANQILGSVNAEMFSANNFQNSRTSTPNFKNRFNKSSEHERSSHKHAKVADRTGARKSTDSTPVLSEVVRQNNNNNNNNYQHQYDNSPSRNQYNNNNNQNNQNNNNNNNQNRSHQRPISWTDDPEKTPQEGITFAKAAYAKVGCWKCNMWSPNQNQNGTPITYTHKDSSCLFWNDNGTKKENRKKDLDDRKKARQ